MRTLSSTITTYGSIFRWAFVVAAVLFAGTSLIASLAQADSSFACPTAANDGTNISVAVTLENNECSAVNVRLISSIIGNADGTLAGVGIYGPQVAAPLLTVPVGSNPQCGCGSFTPNVCDCTGGAGSVACLVDSDCPFCSNLTPGTLSTSVTVSPQLPAQLVGTVATVLFISEIETTTGDLSTETNECFVEVL